MSGKRGRKEGVALTNLIIFGIISRWLERHYSMLGLMKRAMQFYRLAAEEISKPTNVFFSDLFDKEKTQQNYNIDLAALPDLFWSDLFDFVREWQKEPYFKLKDLDQALYAFTNKNSLNINAVLNNIDTFNLLPEMTHYIVDYCVKAMMSWWQTGLDTNQMLYSGVIEEIKDLLPFASDDLIKKLQRGAILSMLRLFKKSQQSEEREAEYWRHRLEDDWEDHYMMSDPLIPRPFLLELAKTFGGDFWEKMGLSTGNAPRHIEDISPYQHVPGLMNDPEHIWTDKDIEILFRDLRYGAITGDELRQIIEKANGRGRNYLRAFLYRDAEHGALFMLDEDMKPLGQEYQTLPWPEEVVPMKLSILRGLDREGKYAPVWEKIFEEFHVIPA